MSHESSEITPIPLDPRLLNMPGFSQRQILEHFDVLYMGYVNKLNEIRSKLRSAGRLGANATYSEFRSLKKGETYALDGVILHELYFNNLGGTGAMPCGSLLRKIEKDFDSFNDWMQDFIATGMAARGWAVLAYDTRDGRLHNFLQDTHDQGIIVNSKAILVLDVYEHAYFIDYGTRKRDYISAFLQNVNWSVAERRWDGIAR